ncbi:MAG: tetratricopeptide repeat protein [Chiayiivirga sp.]|jgi:cytochrome c-type biogenesis protein CcmH|uniref:c-type cytochrome biogenesis protein CcmI/CycH n=1 Tax=Chiayiivirga sp. TaxID=2041042 RepID=UPI0025BAA4C4|nr:tetratricopeptide repeat protein [Chiayiivirga sp.]MCI1730099.1 tetratricopeptide repeat protein [Chiayiivirga sp.]
MFWVLAAGMTLLALVFVLPSLWRAGAGDTAQRDKRNAVLQAQRAGILDEDEARAKLAALPDATGNATKPSRLVPALLAVALPVCAILLYRQVGEPRAMDRVWQDAAAVASAATGANAADDAGAADVNAPAMEQAVSGLAERLKRERDDLEGWMLLGRAYKGMERFAPAREALANAIRIAPDNPEVMVEYAEALVLASDSRRFEGEARGLLDRALALQPDSQRGLWLLGIAAYQEQDFANAASTWERLLAQIPPDAEPRAALLERIAEARSNAGLAPLVAESDASATGSEPGKPGSTGEGAADGPRLTVRVDIAPDLKAKVGASDVLFVFARAAQGPRMPLAIQRLAAASLPVTVTLDDSTSMMPALKLSTVPQVVVGARISKSGQATPQSGDFEVLSVPIANTHADVVQLTIDQVVP